MFMTNRRYQEPTEMSSNSGKKKVKKILVIHLDEWELITENCSDLKTAYGRLNFKSLSRRPFS